MRLYIMFVGDFEQAATWSTDAVKGSKRFLDKVWNLAESAADSMELTPANEAILHKTIKKVTDDIDTLKMNTAIAAMMTAVNEMTANGVTKGRSGDLPAAAESLCPPYHRGAVGAAGLCRTDRQDVLSGGVACL